MNAKLFAALTIFLFLFSITSYSLENYAFAESTYKTQENPQTRIRPVTGRWKGTVQWSSKWEGVSCIYRGKVTFNLIQNGNVVTGNGKTKINEKEGGKDCRLDQDPFGAVVFNISGSTFSGTVYNGSLQINNGRFTSNNHMKGSFSGKVGGVDVDGSFKASRK